MFYFFNKTYNIYNSLLKFYIEIYKNITLIIYFNNSNLQIKFSNIKQ